MGHAYASKNDSGPLTVVRRILGIGVLVVLLLIGALVAMDSLKVRGTRARAHKVQTGSTREHVRAILGEPVTIFEPRDTNGQRLFLSPDCETWAYGSHIEKSPFFSEFPYFCPVRLRLFRPDSDDVVLEFSFSGVVTNVQIPE